MSGPAPGMSDARPRRVVPRSPGFVPSPEYASRRKREQPTEEEMYRPVPPSVDLPAMERDVLAFWRESDVFNRSMAATKDGPSWIFYEGPPTANGMPGTHHVEARV